MSQKNVLCALENCVHMVPGWSVRSVHVLDIVGLLCLHPPSFCVAAVYIIKEVEVSSSDCRTISPLVLSFYFLEVFHH